MRLQSRAMIHGRSFFFALLIFYISAAGIFSISAAPIVLPAESFNSREQLSALTTSLAQEDFARAATLLDALLGDEADQLMALRDVPGNKDGGLISVSAWMETIPESQRTGLIAAYGDKFDAG